MSGEISKFSPNLFLSFLLRGLSKALVQFIFLHYGDSKKTCNSSLLEKTKSWDFRAMFHQRIISKRSGTQKNILFLGSSHLILIFIRTRTQLKRRRRMKKNDSNLLTDSRTWAAQLASTVFAKRNVKLHFPSFTECNATIFVFCGHIP